MIIKSWLPRSRISLIAYRQTSSFLQWPRPIETFHGDSPNRFSQQLLDVEKHWNRQGKSSHNNPSGEKKYVLSMFPYPSGNLHMGHMRVYTISDVSARYFRLNGFNVIHPIGWDSFGLPAENAARERGVDPREWTRSNIVTMKEQLLRTGVEFDWNREISTCEPEFYRWTQWIFCRLHERGLLRRNLAEVNWDPVDQTVLAAEQIDNEGRSWRSGAKAEKKKLRQWMVETPKYAKRLAEGLKTVTQWHDVVDIQANWIGHCDVYRFMFPLRDSGHTPMEELLDLRVHEATDIAKAWFVVLKQGHALSDASKNGTGETYKLPLSVMNGVTGEWMSVVVVPEDYQGPNMYLNARIGDPVADQQLVSMFNLKSDRRVMPMNLNDVQEIAKFGGFGGYETSRTLQDWVVSRQRAWGTPIPMIISPDGKQAAPIPDNQLPLIQGKTSGQVKCDRFNEGYGFYEQDTLDTFFDSSWYYLRFLDNNNTSRPIDPEKARQMPVDLYVGGIEHAAVHMFFARFISYFLTDIGVTNVAEPFKHLIPQGIVKGKTLIEPESGRYASKENVEVKDGSIYEKVTGTKLEEVFEKMSKSKNNGVDPLTVLEKDGIDLTRLQLLESAAPRQAINWGSSDLKGLMKWLDRIAFVVNTYIEQRQQQTTPTSLPVNEEESIREVYNYFVRNISMCLEVLHLHNTALARMQGLTNALRKIKPETLANSVQAERTLHSLVVMLQAYAPHAAAELWSALLKVQPVSQDFERKLDISEQRWPQVDDDSDVDFSLILGDINCGRIAVGRQQVEHMNDDQLIERMTTVEHKLIMDVVRKRQIQLRNVEVSTRKGLHITVTADINEEDKQVINTALEAIQKEKRKAEKANKKSRNKKKEA